MNELSAKVMLIRMGIENPRKANIMEFDIEQVKAIMDGYEFPTFKAWEKRKFLDTKKVGKITKQYITTIFPNLDLTVDMFDDELSRKPAKSVGEIRAKSQQLNFEVNFRIKSLEAAEREFEEIFLKYARKGSIFDIPMVSEKGDVPMIIRGPVNLFGDPIRMARRMPGYFERIIMEEQTSLRSVCVYAHEITHALIERNKGAIQNFYDKEMLSIFMEKVIAGLIDKKNKEGDLLREFELRGIEEIKQKISAFETLTEGHYTKMYAIASIQGALYAGVLFGKYIKADEQEKTRILAQVEDVLNGKMKLNDFKKAEQLVLDGESIREYINRVGTEYVLPCERPTVKDFRNSPMSDLEIKAKVAGDKKGVGLDLNNTNGDIIQ